MAYEVTLDTMSCSSRSRGEGLPSMFVYTAHGKIVPPYEHGAQELLDEALTQDNRYTAEVFTPEVDDDAAASADPVDDATHYRVTYSELARDRGFNTPTTRVAAEFERIRAAIFEIANI